MLPAADQIAGLIVCVFIIRTAYIVFREAIGQKTDRSCDDASPDELRNYSLSAEGICGIDTLQV